MTLELSNLKPKVTRKPRKRVGRGDSAGQGSFSGKGIKGQHARAGGSHPAGFEGGRTTLIMQTPKMRGKGFRSLQTKEVGINVERLNKLEDNSFVTVKSLIAAGLIKSGPVKILGDGTLKKKLTVKVAVSKSAREKIEKAGGQVIMAETEKAPAE